MAKPNSIIIENFGNMRPDLPTFSAKNTMYSASGVNPVYYLDDNTKQEEIILPLAASVAMTTTFVNTTGTITDIISVQGTTPYAIADVNGNIINGTATRTSVFSAGTVLLSSFGNYIIASSSASVNIAYAGIFSSTFNTVVGTGVSGPYYMTPFLNFLAVGSQNLVYNVPISGFPANVPGTPALTLSAGYNIIGKPEVYGNYLSIPYAPSTISFVNNYLALWNGILPLPSYNILLPGKFVGQVCIAGTLYIVIEERTGIQTLGYLKQYSYIRKRTLHGTFSTTANKTKAVFNARGYVGINTDAGLYLYKADEGLGEIAYLHDTNNYSVVISSSNGINDAYDLYGVIGNTVYTTNGSTNYNPIAYKSQFAQVTPYRLKVWYNTPPQSSTDAIYTTLLGIDEYDPTGNIVNETATLNTITSTSFDNYKYTILDCQGFTGDKMSISLTTVNTSSWRPVIKRIEIVPQLDN